MSARFYGEMNGVGRSGPGGATSRIGSEAIECHVRGWNIGIEARVFKNEYGDDEVTVRLTGGSNRPNDGKIVFTNEHTGEETELSLADALFTFKVPNLRMDM